MHRFVYWFLVCLFVAVATFGLAYFALWEMRSRFIPGYADSKILCERRSLVVVLPQHEEDPALTLQASPAMAQAKECVTMLTQLGQFRESIPKRAGFFSIVVFLATLIVRFVMFPIRRRSASSHKHDVPGRPAG